MVLHLPGWFNLISQSQIFDKNVQVEPVNHYSHTLCNGHRKLIGTIPQVDGIIVLDHMLHWVPESTEYTVIVNDSWLLALATTGHTSWDYAESGYHGTDNWHTFDSKPWGSCWQYQTLQEWLDSVIATIAWNTNWQEIRFTTNTTSHATELLQLVHLGIGGPMDAAIGGLQYILHFIDDSKRHSDAYILKYNSDPLPKFQVWNAHREMDLGKQVKGFCTNGGSEYTSKKFVQYVEIVMIEKLNCVLPKRATRPVYIWTYQSG